MYQLLMHMPVIGTLALVALLAGPLANLSIVAGAWMCETLVNAGARALNRLPVLIQIRENDDSELR
jgi:hypothetical protein